MTANELRAISRKLSTYLELHPDDKDARSMADRSTSPSHLPPISRSTYPQPESKETGHLK